VEGTTKEVKKTYRAHGLRREAVGKAVYGGATKGREVKIVETTISYGDKS